MMTDKCTSTIAEEKHGDFAEQNHVNASLGSYFLCTCTHLFRNDVDSQHHAAEPYRSICTDRYICLSKYILITNVLAKLYLSEITFARDTPFTELPHVTLQTHIHTHTHMHTL